MRGLQDLVFCSIPGRLKKNCSPQRYCMGQGRIHERIRFSLSPYFCSSKEKVYSSIVWGRVVFMRRLQGLVFRPISGRSNKIRCTPLSWSRVVFMRGLQGLVFRPVPVRWSKMLLSLISTTFCYIHTDTNVCLTCTLMHTISN